MHQKFYAEPNRQTQQNFILSHVQVSKPKRQRSRCHGADDYHRKKVTTKYFIPVLKGNQSDHVQVCKKLFTNTLCVSRDRVQTLCTKFLESGELPKEQRGGDTRSAKYSDKKS